nr:unnamed protein product [Digitaria exilis]
MGRLHTSADFIVRDERPFNPKDAEDTLELLDLCVEALQDSRHATREKALAELAGALEHQLPALDELHGRCFSIFTLCRVCVKEGSPKEVRLAYRAVGLLALTLRSGPSELLFHSVQPLARAFRERDDAPPVTTVAAIDCLAAVTFAGARGRDDAERSLKALLDHLITPSAAVSSSRSASKISGGGARRKTITPQVLVAAVSAWAFLVTTMVSEADALIRKADGAAWNAAVATLAGLLDHDDRGVRMAAGEALAVCVELNLTRHALRRDMDAVAAKVSELASEFPGRGSNNTTLPEQRDLFGQIAAFLEHGERPEKSLPTSVDGCVALRVSSWAKLAQLSFLGRFLGDGFEKHVQGNELLKEAFSYGAREGKVLSISKKKQGKKTPDKDSKYSKG